MELARGGSKRDRVAFTGLAAILDAATPAQHSGKDAVLGVEQSEVRVHNKLELGSGGGTDAAREGSFSWRRIARRVALS